MNSDPDQAVLALKKALSLDPQCANEWVLLGQVHSKTARWQEALAAGQKAVEIYRTMASERPEAFLPDLAMSLNNLGVVLSELGRREEALDATKEAVEH